MNIEVCRRCQFYKEGAIADMFGNYYLACACVMTPIKYSHSDTVKISCDIGMKYVKWQGSGTISKVMAGSKEYKSLISKECHDEHEILMKHWNNKNIFDECKMLEQQKI